MTTDARFRTLLSLDALPGPASRISRSKAADLVAAAMNHETRSRVNLKAVPRRKPWQKVALLAAASFVVPVTVAAGVARFVATRHAGAALFAPTLTIAPRVEPKSTNHAGGTNAVSPRAVDAPVVEEVAPVPALEDQPSDPALIDVPRAPEPSRGKPAPAAVTRGPAPDSTPRDMLQKANDLRIQHQWLAATEVYEKTLRTFPGRAEAYSAMVAAGVLRLDQLGDPKGALSLFSAAIRARPRGPLSEEARWGAIQAHRALGDQSTERKALQEFVTLHPQSLLAWRAQARLRELGGDVAPR